MELAGGCQHLVRPRSHANVFGKVVPAHDFRSIDQKFGRPRNVVAFGTPADMKQMVATDHCRVGVRKNRERVAGLFGQVLRDRGSIHADGNWAHSCRFEFRQPLFNAS